VHTGLEALKFVEDKCKPFANRITNDGLIELNPTSPIAYKQDKDVRRVLFTKLKGKAKSLRFLTGVHSPRANLPFARGVPNALNVTPAKLKVVLILQLRSPERAPAESGSAWTYKTHRKPFKDVDVPVKMVLSGSGNPPRAKNTVAGVADFGNVAKGKYT